MKKRTYKRMKNRLYREMQEKIYEKMLRVSAEGKIADAERTAEYYKKRFREFGTNVDTVDLKSGNYVAQLKWELTPEQWGKYMNCAVHPRMAGMAQIPHRDLAYEIAQSLIENNLIQFTSKDSMDYGGPLSEYYTIGAKLYVVPWEQMPHRRTMKMKQWVDAIENDGEGIL